MAKAANIRYKNIKQINDMLCTVSARSWHLPRLRWSRTNCFTSSINDETCIRLLVRSNADHQTRTQTTVLDYDYQDITMQTSTITYMPYKTADIV